MKTPLWNLPREFSNVLDVLYTFVTECSVALNNECKNGVTIQVDLWQSEGCRKEKRFLYFALDSERAFCEYLQAWITIALFRAGESEQRK